MHTAPYIMNSAHKDSQLTAVALKLLDYCQQHNWSGWDPYDALNSRLFEWIPFLNFRLARLSLTQLVKRSPINLRPFLLIPPSQNPKGLALFISALLRLSKLEIIPNNQLALDLLKRLADLRSKDNPHWCWGYPFPWQSRGGLFPRWLPNVICTTFAGNALLDAYEELKNPQYLTMAISTADFLIETLYYEEPGSIACFSYTPLLRSRVHNANLLGSAFLCRVAAQSGIKTYCNPAIKAARYTVSHQETDGSWAYGDHPTQGWIDNFHTGYNLCALRQIEQNTGSDEFSDSLRRGFAFYRENFFLTDGTPKYYHDRTYPIDIHSAAQSIITLSSLKDLDTGNLSLAQSIWQWSLQHMWNEAGYFYFQKHPLYTNAVPHMRWSQAWMLLALSMILHDSANNYTTPS
jgi:hypothetical protein